MAGMAVLVRQRFPEFTPQQVTQYLKDHAERRGSVPNNTWGYGFAKLPTHGGVAPPPPPASLDDCAIGGAVKGTAGSHGYRMKMAELRAHNLRAGVMVDQHLAALTGKRLAQYHSDSSGTWRE